ncbi:hypothetical protein GY45DRAFT_1104820 [Cubamyces sp. BRFM 1775]|nr:hypothetical protein GY45DRAFT_1104820 [Cubamyces sp. BRFM 1775]
MELGIDARTYRASREARHITGLPRRALSSAHGTPQNDCRQLKGWITHTCDWTGTHREDSSEKDRPQHIVHHTLVHHASLPEHPLHGIPATRHLSVHSCKSKGQRLRTSLSTPGLSPRTGPDRSCTSARCRAPEGHPGSGPSALSRSKATLFRQAR